MHLASFAYTLLTDIYIVKLSIVICFKQCLLINLTSVWLHTTLTIHLNEIAIVSRCGNTLAVDPHSAHSISFCNTVFSAVIEASIKIAHCHCNQFSSPLTFICFAIDDLDCGACPCLKCSMHQIISLPDAILSRN